jgi:hypothetical protein
LRERKKWCEVRSASAWVFIYQLACSNANNVAKESKPEEQVETGKSKRERVKEGRRVDAFF